MEIETDVTANEDTQPERRPDDGDWFEEWFRSDFYLKLYSHRDHEEAEACVDLILRSASLPTARADGMKIAALDLACGPGRHAIALAERGVNVTAVDLSPTLLAYARAEADAAGTDVRFLRSDMRAIDFAGEFDLVLQLFTSFGYFEDRSDDALVLERVRRALRAEGFYALDLINARRLRETLVPRSERRFHELTIVEERSIVEGRVEKTITIPAADGTPRTFMESVRLYEPEEIEGMLFDSGFSPVHWFGDYDGTPFDPASSERMLVVSRAEA